MYVEHSKHQLTVLNHIRISHAITEAPSCKHCLTISFPIPEAAPVTINFLFLGTFYLVLLLLTK